MRLIDRYKILGETPNFDLEIPKSLRVNTLKITPEQLVQRLEGKGITLKKIEYLEYGYIYDAPFSLGSTPEYLQGYYYLQEAASQIPVQVLDLKETDKVLDMAASPGSKTTQIAQYTKNLIIALDTNRHRLESLKNNIERLSIPNVVILNKDARFADDLGEFDKILLDAPCSGNFCINPNYYKERTITDIQGRSILQKELIKTASKCLKKGGILVYSTCSLEIEENEEVIDWAIKNTELKIIDTKLKIGQPGYTKSYDKDLDQNLNKTRRFWPHKTQTEGFFIAKLTK